MSSVSAQSVEIDGHQLWVEQDVIVQRAVGVVTPAVVDWVIAASLRILAQHPHYYILGDLRDAGPIPPDLRRRYVDHGIKHPPRAIAFYRVSVIALGINALLFGALNVLAKRKQPFRQFSTESEARQWLSSQRPEPAPRDL